MKKKKFTLDTLSQAIIVVVVSNFLLYLVEKLRKIHIFNIQNLKKKLITSSYYR